MAVYHSEIKAVLPSQKMNYNGLFFCGRNYYLICSSWQTWKIRNLHDIVKDK